MPADPATSPDTGSRSEQRLFALQVEEVYSLAPTAAAFSYFGSLLTLGVLVEIGNAVGGGIWFLYVSAVTFFRAFLFIAYRRRAAGSDVRRFARGMLLANLLAGVQWGLLGTLFFPMGPAYAQLFTLMVIICFIAGSITAYAALRGAHEILSIPATIPTSLYVFFFHDGAHWYAGIAALFFCFAIVYYAGRLHRSLATASRLQMERDELSRLTQALNAKLEQEKGELAHRAAVRGASAESARDEAARLLALFERSPLPQLECDANGAIVASNAAAQRLLGRSRAELMGTPFTAHLSSAHDWGFLHEASSRSVGVDMKTAGGSVPCTLAVTQMPAAPGYRPGFGLVVTGVPVPLA